MIQKVNEGLYYDERSAGGIVYRQDNGKVLWMIIKTLSKKNTVRAGTSQRKTVFKFPKGHLNDNEVLKAAALREVEEEGRIKSKIISKIGSNDYIIWDKEAHKKIIKKVTFFLMEYEGESNLKYYDNEVVIDRAWFSFDEAMGKLSYDSEKVLLRKANNRLLELKK